jgi:hypothetical protein
MAAQERSKLPQTRDAMMGPCASSRRLSHWSGQSPKAPAIPSENGISVTAGVQRRRTVLQRYSGDVRVSYSPRCLEERIETRNPQEESYEGH